MAAIRNGVGKRETPRGSQVAKRCFRHVGRRYRPSYLPSQHGLHTKRSRVERRSLSFGDAQTWLTASRDTRVRACRPRASSQALGRQAERHTANSSYLLGRGLSRRRPVPRRRGGRGRASRLGVGGSRIGRSTCLPARWRQGPRPAAARWHCRAR